ncbi:stalk domain-containing protein [Cohnella zeiphila]|uniref:stalk domain-containing protein n=1 Tax=Cohnella zeiphila TaxID=2761120 RepID=UPI001EE1D243|nr:stalk domain-containing protein [Cohnella zeiphila]
MKSVTLVKIASAASLTALLLHVNPAAAASSPPPPVYLDGKLLPLPVDPVIVSGQSLVPMRAILESEGAKVSWDAGTKTVTATKNDVELTYRIGSDVAYEDGRQLALSTPGQTVNGTTMVPLRFFSESLGNVVKWHSYSRTISISSAKTYETNVEYGANLRSTPDSASDSNIVRLLPTGTHIHVIREIDADWLEVQTENGEIDFLSAKPKYTDYGSASLTDKQADELIAAGSEYLGTPYEFGASSDQTDTFDCSSFVKRVFQQALSIDLPRVSYDQAKVGKEVSIDDLQKGDLLFFSARGLDIGHVAIYAGDGQLLHTYSKTLGVHFEKFDGQWKDRFVTARRIL